MSATDLPAAVETSSGATAEPTVVAEVESTPKLNEVRRSSPFATRVGPTIRLERQRALRALLQHPLLTADGPRSEEFGLVRRHADWLQQWLAHQTGWGLVVDSELARLRKTPDNLSDETHSAHDVKSDTPFTRRRYMLLCLSLAALEREDRQTTLGRIADALVAFVADDPAIAEAGMTFELSRFEHRRDLVQVIRVLQQYRVLRRVSGEEEQYLGRTGDVLYDIDRPALAAMLAVRRGPSTVAADSTDARILEMLEEPFAESEEAQERRLRCRLSRRLIDEPVVYYEELDEREFAYLNSHRSKLLGQIERWTGLVAEVRREGIAMLDAAGDLTDLPLIQEGTDGHLTMLVIDYLTEQLRRDERVVVEFETLRRHVQGLIEEHRSHWRKSVAEPNAATLLTQQVIDRLTAFKLVRLTGGLPCKQSATSLGRAVANSAAAGNNRRGGDRSALGVVPMPAIARYAVADDVRHAGSSGPADKEERSTGRES